MDLLSKDDWNQEAIRNGRGEKLDDVINILANLFLVLPLARVSKTLYGNQPYYGIASFFRSQLMSLYTTNGKCSQLSLSLFLLLPIQIDCCYSCQC